MGFNLGFKGLMLSIQPTKCFALTHASDAELFTLCVMLNVGGIVQREL